MIGRMEMEWCNRERKKARKLKSKQKGGAGREGREREGKEGVNEGKG
jgi:hypothetical protein